MSDHFGELRSLLQRAPQVQTLWQWHSLWRRLCQAIEHIGADMFCSRYLPYVLNHLESWPDTVRQLPPRWFESDGLVTRRHEVLSLARVYHLPHDALWLTDDAIIPNPMAHLKVGLDVSASPWDERLFLPPMRLNDDVEMIWREDDVDGQARLLEQQTRVLTMLAARSSATSSLSLSMQVSSSQMQECLTSAPWLESLTSLNLSYNKLDDAFATFLSGESLPALKQLWMADNSLSTFGLMFLVQAPWFERLESIHLGYHDFGNDGVSFLLHAHLPKLQALHWKACGVTADGAQMLAQSPLLNQLHTVDLLNNDIGLDGTAALLTSPHVDALRTLQLGRTHGGHEAMVSWAETDRLSALHALGLRANALGVEGARLLASAAFDQLNVVDLAYNDLGPEGMAHLIEAPWFRRLQRVSMTHNQLGPEGLDAWSWGIQDGELQALDLSLNRIGDHGALMLSDWESLRSCQHLVLRRNGITARGMMHLAQSTVLSALEVLDLKGNSIGLEGAIALTQAPFLPHLRQLSVRSWDVSREGIDALANAERMPTHLRAQFKRHLARL